MALVSGSNWFEKYKYEEETGNPYEEKYPETKWDSNIVATPMQQETGCPKCDCTATKQTLTIIMASMEKFSEYQEKYLGEIISQLKSRIAAESGSTAKSTRASVVGGLAAVYGEEQVVADFWSGLEQIESMFSSRVPLPSDTKMLQEQLKNIDRFAATYVLDASKMATWKQKLNSWISKSLSSKGKTIYFAPNVGEFGSGR